MTYHNAHAAKVDDNGVVEKIIVIPYSNDDDEAITDYCNSIGLSGRFIDTSYIGARRGKYAGIGYTFNPDMGEHGMFIPPQPFPSWVLDEDANWQPPVSYPEGGLHTWDESTQEWQVVTD